MNRLVLIVLGLLVCLTPARAEAPVCGGTDLLADLRDRDPVAYYRVIAEAQKAPNVEAILWRVEADGVPPSHLFGTAHVTDPRVTTLSPEAADAFARAKVVALELKELRNSQELAMASMRQAQYMVLPPGQSLWDLIPDSDEASVRENPNLPEAARKSIFGLQPWVVAMSLSIPLCETERRAAGLSALDQLLARQAEAQGSELVGLETVEEQFRAMSSLPLDKQAEYLVASAKLSPRAADYMETLITAYQQRLITALEPLSAEIEGQGLDLKSIMAGMEKSLLIDRNHLMAERAATLFDRGSAFVAVGALHLPGNEGLVELLRKAGYKVTPVN